MSDDEFLDKKIKFIKVYIILGILLLLIGIYLNVFSITIGDFWLIMINTWGAVFIVMGIVRALMYKNKAILKFYKIHETDERSELLRGKAGYLTFVFSTVGLAICGVIFAAMGLIIPFTIILILLFAQYILFFILMWNYSKKL